MEQAYLIKWLLNVCCVTLLDHRVVGALFSDLFSLSVFWCTQFHKYLFTFLHFIKKKSFTFHFCFWTFLTLHSAYIVCRTQSGRFWGEKKLRIFDDSDFKGWWTIQVLKNVNGALIVAGDSGAMKNSVTAKSTEKNCNTMLVVIRYIDICLSQLQF